MKLISLNDPNEVLKIKNEIDKIRIDNGEITEATDMVDFVTELNMDKTIYVKEGSVVPFRIIYEFMIVAGDESKYDDAYIFLQRIDFDLTSLKQIKPEMVMLGLSDDAEFIIMNGLYYTIR